MLEIKIKVKDKGEAQRIVALLGMDHDITFAKYKKDAWVLNKKGQAKYFLKKRYIDFNKNKIVDYEKNLDSK